MILFSISNLNNVLLKSLANNGNFSYAYDLLKFVLCFEIIRPADNEEMLAQRIVALANEYGRYGNRRVMAMLRKDGWTANHKRVERIWRRAGLNSPRGGGYG